MHKLNIKIPIYESSCYIIVADDIEKVINRYVKKFKWNSDTAIPDGEELHGYAVNAGNLKHYYIFYGTKSVTANILSHEISHLVDDILDDRDIELKGEARAYLTGHITEKVFDFVLKKKLLRNKWLNQSTNKEEEKKIETTTVEL